MNNSRIQFADELEALLGVNGRPSEHIDEIATWAYRWRLTHQDEVDDEVDAWLLDLGFMSMGQEFELGDVELRQMIVSARCSI
ncbi:hypothetical protein [Luteibacter sp.]|uniref:hypothetical protein n=1 Tax=Luteibacter sp. TaxID=1886636 RepID=UPI003F81EA05